MFFKNRKIFFIFLCTIILTACQGQLTYSYLMEHPKTLQQEVDKCEAINHKSNEQTQYCDIVMTAAVDFTSVFNEFQQDPEKFGKKVLESEIEYVKAKNELNHAKQQLNTLKSQKVAYADLQQAQNELERADNAYQGSETQMNILLAVIGTRSPE